MPVGRDKKPLLSSWKTWQQNRATMNKVHDWDMKWVNHNVGIITGEISNLSIVDFDLKRDTKGNIVGKYDEDFYALFPPTLSVETPNGGIHMYYRFSLKALTCARIMPFVDIRSTGGYVVGPSSETDDQLKDGELKRGGVYSIRDNLPIAAFPEHLFENIAREKSQTDWGKLYNGVESGSRNEAAAKYAGLLLRTFKKQKSEAWKELLEWNKRNIPPLPTPELKLVFESISTREDRKQDVSQEEIKEAIKETRTHTYTEVVEMAITELKSTDPKQILSFGYEFLDNKLTGIFPGEMVIIGGESGTGKTTFAMNIAYKASLTKKVMVFALEDRLVDYGIKALFFEINRIRKGKGMKGLPWNAYRRNEVEALDYESQREEAQRNLKNEKLLFVSCPRQITLEVVENTIANATEDGVELFLIDHLHYFDLTRGNKSKADYVEEVMVRLKQLQTRVGARILMVVHYRKLNGQKPSLDSFKDSIAIPQNANYVLNLWRDRSPKAERPEETMLFIPKSRNPNGEATFVMKFDPEKNDYEQVSTSFGGPQSADKTFEEW